MPKAPRKRETLSLDEFPHPSVAVDLVLLSTRGRDLQVLLTDRPEEPRGLALPGRFVRLDEDLESAVREVLERKAHLQRRPRLQPLRPFGRPDRDPRGHVISLPHVAMLDFVRFGLPTIEWDHIATVSLDDELRVELGDARVRLLFDHEEILAEAIREFRRRLELGESDVVADLLPERFTLRQLRLVHEALTGKPINKDSFRRQMADRLAATGELEEDVGHRPAEYYSWR